MSDKTFKKLAIVGVGVFALWAWKRKSGATMGMGLAARQLKTATNVIEAPKSFDDAFMSQGSGAVVSPMELAFMSKDDGTPRVRQSIAKPIERAFGVAAGSTGVAKVRVPERVGTHGVTLKQGGPFEVFGLAKGREAKDLKDIKARLSQGEVNQFPRQRVRPSTFVGLGTSASDMDRFKMNQARLTFGKAPKKSNSSYGVAFKQSDYTKVTGNRKPSGRHLNLKAPPNVNRLIGDGMVLPESRKWQSYQIRKTPKVRISADATSFGSLDREPVSGYAGIPGPRYTA